MDGVRLLSHRHRRTQLDTTKHNRTQRLLLAAPLPPRRPTVHLVPPLLPVAWIRTKRNEEKERPWRIPTKDRGETDVDRRRTNHSHVRFVARRDGERRERHPGHPSNRRDERKGTDQPRKSPEETRRDVQRSLRTAGHQCETRTPVLFVRQHETIDGREKTQAIQEQKTTRCTAVVELDALPKRSTRR